MKITVSVHRKAGRPNFGSDGAGCEIELDLPEGTVTEHPETLVAEIRRAYDLAGQAVAEQLAKGQPEPGSDPEREPAPQQQKQPRPDYGRRPSQAQPPSYPEPERQQPPPRREPERRPPHGDPRDEYESRGPRNDPHNGPPKTGRELYAWAKKQQEENGCDGLIDRLNQLGAQCGYPRKLVDWNRQETADGLALWRRVYSAEPVHNGHSNGNGDSYHNGNGRNGSSY